MFGSRQSIENAETEKIDFDPTRSIGKGMIPQKEKEEDDHLLRASNKTGSH